MVTLTYIARDESSISFSFRWAFKFFKQASPVVRGYHFGPFGVVLFSRPPDPGETLEAWLQFPDPGGDPREAPECDMASEFDPDLHQCNICGGDADVRISTGGKAYLCKECYRAAVDVKRGGGS